MDLEMLLQQIMVFFNKAVRARPLQMTLIYTLSFLGWMLGKMSGQYVLGYLILLVNGALFIF